MLTMQHWHRGYRSNQFRPSSLWFFSCLHVQLALGMHFMRIWTKTKVRNALAVGYMLWKPSQVTPGELMVNEACDGVKDQAFAVHCVYLRVSYTVHKLRQDPYRCNQTTYIARVIYVKVVYCIQSCRFPTVWYSSSPIAGVCNLSYR